MDRTPLGPPTLPLSVNVTGLPASPVAVAVRVFGPAVGPSVHDVTAALPLELVATGIVGLTVPPPDATVNNTPTPTTGLLKASTTCTAGGTATAVPAGAVWLSPACFATCAAGPALRAIALEVTIGRFPLAKPSV
jgi:hypothetical protein